MGKQVILEGFIGEARTLQRFAIDVFPYTIGRDVTCPLRLNTDRVSRLHAQVDDIHGQFCITDLHSTNGTYVNHERVTQSAPLQHGDAVHFANNEFRVVLVDDEPGNASDILETMVGLNSLSCYFPTQGKEFSELLAQGLVQGYSQGILDRQGKCIGYELLGRSTHPGLQEGPVTLFTLAHTFDEEINLSELLRRQCVSDAHAMKLTGRLFFNTHPKECQEPERLLKELQTLRGLYPMLPLVCEIHEAAVTDCKRMADLKAGLQELRIGLAYDDFGAGQARLLELTKVPPDVLKFDYALIVDLTKPGTAAYRLVETLTTLAHEIGVQTLAEGVETEAVARTCMDLGIDQQFPDGT
jgi:EAL domain-containing protein (putative c-di-GMP-specific phosphodiesterase class I)